MSVFKHVTLLFAQVPKPSRLLSWCLSSRFSWIRKKAEQYYSDQVFSFRLKERAAIEEASIIEQAVRKNLQLDGSYASIKRQLDYLNKANARMCEEIRNFPEVKNILTVIYNELLNLLKPKPKTAPQKAREFYSHIFVKPKAEETLTQTAEPFDFNGAVEINTHLSHKMP